MTSYPELGKREAGEQKPESYSEAQAASVLRPHLPAPRRVVILGAGPAGLAAGCHLAYQGCEPLLLEKESYVGGLCHTLTHEGFRFDIGGHRWFTKNREVDAWVKGLMGDEFVRVGRVSRIYFEGKYFPYPIRLPNVLRTLGPIGSLRVLLSYLAAQVHSRLSPRTMEDAFVRQFGRRLYEMFFKTYSEKVWGRPCSELSADWVGQRTKGLSVWETVRRSLLGNGNKVVSLAEEFSYPRTGYCRISERMAEELTQHGGRIGLKTRVAGIVLDGERITGVRVAKDGGGTEVIPADDVISTIPLPVLVRLLEAAVPQRVHDACASLEFRHLITVTVLVDKERVSDDTWLYVHDPAVPFGRLHEPKNWSAAMAPAGQTSLVAEFFVDEGDDLFRKSDDELYQMTVDYLTGGMGLLRREEAIGGVVFRARNAYPIYSLDYMEHLRTVKAHVSRILNLQIVGRGGNFRYNNSDHSIEMGMLAARNVLGGRYDLDEVNAEGEYLEER